MSAPQWLIVPAAGRGTRMRAACPKQYLLLDEAAVLACTLARLNEAFPEATLLLCLDSEDQWFHESMVPFAHWHRLNGGNERVDSVRAGIDWLTDRAHVDDWVLVHDVARPCVTVADLHHLMDTIRHDPVGGLLAAPVTDTLKRQDADQRVDETVPRQGLWRALTPQGFRYGVLQEAFRTAREANFLMTDEASGVERLGHAPRLVTGRSDNLKITHPEDLALAAQILSAQRASVHLSLSDKEPGHEPV
ncbi:2-C-methyl-D-erythritol 4-phosphate cytidylyltransferase [Kushneria marisflavi]|uniref:2-C-methyl-D-erythritol 4-phosphate cytidylyltransferase n=1 Tax=Kushneria marisflavi TaxID=157779 RepID=A0A240US37_9GAMM|nr:2-C-methyl-D-erythritol 4-phosphate cytidylyltransferase [Kushneria marisflavi]ART63925.1 2-C-methyl-D-erythritol 4-phosphate cytidylyltransferase [Kushneria marisflavi]RKD85641.1 2-C-methyl-D-erythritol 4-phosphate cytidylyltransferase [Kushneria marisflavi]